MSTSGIASERIGSERMEAGDNDLVLDGLPLSSGLSGIGKVGEEPKRKANGDVRDRDIEGR